MWPLRYLRFDYTTGDAAGQNLTGKATLAACEWISRTHPDRPEFILSGQIDRPHVQRIKTSGHRELGLRGFGPTQPAQHQHPEVGRLQVT